MEGRRSMHVYKFIIVYTFYLPVSTSCIDLCTLNLKFEFEYIPAILSKLGIIRQIGSIRTITQLLSQHITPFGHLVCFSHNVHPLGLHVCTLSYTLYLMCFRPTEEEEEHDDIELTEEEKDKQ